MANQGGEDADWGKFCECRRGGKIGRPARNYDQTGGGFRWNPKLRGGGIEQIPMSPDGLPPRLVGEIDA